MFHFLPPENVRKPEVFWCFQGAQEWSTGVKCFKNKLIIKDKVYGSTWMRISQTQNSYVTRFRLQRERFRSLIGQFQKLDRTFQKLILCMSLTRKLLLFVYEFRSRIHDFRVIWVKFGQNRLQNIGNKFEGVTDKKLSRENRVTGVASGIVYSIIMKRAPCETLYCCN